MRSLTGGEAADLLGIDHTYLRKLHREGKISDVETTAGSHRRYTHDDIWQIRQALEASAKKPGTYAPGRRAGDELQVVSVVNFKGGSGNTTTSAHLAQRLCGDRAAGVHLTKIMAALAQAGIVTTRRGGGGGATLAQPPEQIRLGQVVRVLEAGQPLVACFAASGGDCTITGCCRLKARLGAAETAFLADLDRATLADVALPPLPLAAGALV